MVRIVPSSRSAAQGPDDPGDDLPQAASALSALLDKIPISLFALDAEGRFTAADGAGLERLALRPAEVVGRSAVEVFAGEPRLADLARRALRGEALTSMDTLRSGRVLESRWCPLRGTGGELAAVGCMALDVTDLHGPDLRKLQATEQLPALVWTTDRALQVTWVAGRSAGLAALDPAGRRTLELERELGPGAAEAHRAALAGGTRRYRLSWRGRSLEGQVAPLLDPAGQPVGCVGLALDVSEREALLSLLRATLESSHDGVLVVDRARRIVTFNRRFLDMWGLPADLGATEDRRVLAMALERLADPAGFLARVEALYAAPEAEAEDVLLMKDGRVFERTSLPQRLDGRVVGRVWSFRDVTARRRAEESRDRLLETERVARARAEEEERWRRALVDGVDAILWERPAGCADFSYVSNGGPSILGYSSQRWLAPDFWRSVVEPADAARVFAVYRLPWTDLGPRRVEYRVRGADDQVRWLHDQVSLVHDDRGEVTHLRGISVDVTARKAAEEGLASSEARLRALFESTPNVAIQGFDEQGRVRWWNQASTHLYGYTREEALGRTLSELGLYDAPADVSFRRQLLDVARSGVTVGPSESSVRRRDGATLSILSTIVATPGPTEPRLFCMDIDLTERRQAEQALAAHARRLEVLASVSRQLDAAQLEVGALARALAQGLGAALGETCAVVIHGEARGDLDAVEAHPDEPAAWALAARARDREGVWARVEATGRSARSAGEAAGADASTAIASLFVAPVVARGHVLGTLTLASPGAPACTEPDGRVVEDLAERAGLAMESARLLRAAEAAIRLRDDFLSVASHELRTPLQSLGLVVQSLQGQALRPGGLQALDARTVGRTLDTLLRQQRRLSRLVDALLDVTRLEAGKLHMELEDVDLTQVVREVVDLFRGELAQAGCHLTVHADEPLVGRWDRGRLEQVFANLLSNAAKYGAGQPVEVEVSRRAGAATVSVHDHGIGMSDSTTAQIFQRFKRGVSSRHYGGLGLGLFIARQIVEALGGTIHVASAPGRGATFTVALPLTGPAPGSRRAPADPGGPRP